jgi:uncharacterized protein (DUF58 family)
VRPTRRGVAVLAAAVSLVTSGWWLRYPLLTLLGVAGIAAVAAALLAARHGPRVEVTRTIHPQRVQRGGPAAAVLSVRPAGTLVEIRDTVAGQVRVVRTAGSAEYPLPTGARGRFAVGPLAVGREDPLGLARGWRRAGGSATLVVYPRQLPAAAPGPAADDVWRGATEQHGVREYEPGDDVRHLHWRATAHTGRLMVRDLTDPRQARLTVLLDTRVGSLGAADFEEAVDLAASLLGAAGRAGLRTRLFIAGGREVAEPFLEALVEVRQDDARTPAADGVGGRLVLITGESAAPAVGGAVVLSLGRGVGAAEALRHWNEERR